LPIKIEKTDEKISSRMTNILSWIAAALLGAASAVVLALLVWNGFLYLEYLRQPPLARPFSHGSFAPVGDDNDWTFKPLFAENAAVSFGSSGASATRYGRIEDVHILPIVVAECEGGVLVLRKRSQRDASSAKPSAIVTLNAVGRMLVGVPKRSQFPFDSLVVLILTRLRQPMGPHTLITFSAHLGLLWSLWPCLSHDE
jgi:hypothetical protein